MLCSHHAVRCRGRQTSAKCRAVDLAEFGGKLAFDDMSRQAAADDFGHIVHQLPAAVLNPTSIEDVVKMVRFATHRGVKIAMNGNSHSCFGHAQVKNGVVIHSSALKVIHRIAANTAHVDACVTWHELARAILAHGTAGNNSCAPGDTHYPNGVRASDGSRCWWLHRQSLASGE